jgi:hypothetical protein
MQRFYLETFEAAAGSSYRRTAYEKHVPYWEAVAETGTHAGGAAATDADGSSTSTCSTSIRSRSAAAFTSIRDLPAPIRPGLVSTRDFSHGVNVQVYKPAYDSNGSSEG